MSEFVANFHFLRPWWLLLGILPVWGYWRYYKGCKNQSSWEKVCDQHLLDYLLVKGSSVSRKAVGYLAMTAFLVAVIAIAGPTWKKIDVPNLVAEKPLMILLNLSSDMEETDLTPNRLGRAKFEIKDLLSMVKGVQAGMIVYSEEPFLISPITDDTRLIENLLPEVHLGIMPVNGDRLDRAIEMAVAKMQDAGYAEGRIAVFAADVGQRFDLAIRAAATAAEKGFKVDAAEINAKSVDKLKIIAQNGQGVYIKINAGDNDMKKVADIINDSGSNLKVSENVKNQWMDFGYYLVFVPLLACLYFFRKGIVFALLLVLMTQAAEARFLLNKDQAGLRDYNKNDFVEALNNFEDPSWRGASYYRIGNFEAALKEFNSVEGVEAMYNVGNALAKLGKIEDAIGKYEEVLRRDPNHEDAKFNLEYLKQQQEQNQQQQQQNQNQESEQDQEQNQDQQQQNDEQNQQQDQENSQQDQALAEEQEQKKNAESEQNRNGNTQEAQEPQEQETEKAAEMKEGDEASEYDEQVQAKAQQYRDIPENPGGLLKAFIQKEYNKNRYEK